MQEQSITVHYRPYGVYCGEYSADPREAVACICPSSLLNKSCRRSLTWLTRSFGSCCAHYSFSEIAYSYSPLCTARVREDYSYFVMIIMSDRDRRVKLMNEPRTEAGGKAEKDEER